MEWLSRMLGRMSDWAPGRKRSQAALAASRGVVPGAAPTAREKELHLPRDEAALLASLKGPRVERIVALYRQGKLARGVLLRLGSTDGPDASMDRGRLGRGVPQGGNQGGGRAARPCASKPAGRS